MAARSRGVVRMMTRTTTTHPKGVNRKDLESGKLWRKKKKKDWSLASSGKKKTLTHIYSHSHREVHTSTHDGEKAQSLTSSRTRRGMEGRKAQSQIFFVKYPDGSEEI